MKHKTASRNQAIFASYEQGHSVESLAFRHGLTPKSIRQILAMEKHRLAVSCDSFYETLRELYRLMG